MLIVINRFQRKLDTKYKTSGKEDGIPYTIWEVYGKGLAKVWKAGLICQLFHYVEHFIRNSGSLPLPSWQLRVDR